MAERHDKRLCRYDLNCNCWCGNCNHKRHNPAPPANAGAADLFVDMLFDDDDQTLADAIEAADIASNYLRPLRDALYEEFTKVVKAMVE